MKYPNTKFAISTDKAIKDHIAAHPEGGALVYATTFGSPVPGWVTACDLARRTVTVQDEDGLKHSYSFDHIVVPA